jgi:hypothetical protein
MSPRSAAFIAGCRAAACRAAILVLGSGWVLGVACTPAALKDGPASSGEGAGADGGDDGGDAGDPSDTAVEEIPGSGDPVDPTDAVFDPTVVATISLTVDPADWAGVRDDPWAREWVPADFTWGDEAVPGVAIRAFGHGSLRAGKPSIKISFDRLTDGQLWRELDELKLDNSSQDPGYLNEFIATGVMRRMGLPAARTGWAELVVNGDPVGFFVVLEPVDDRFVERWYGHDDGALYSTLNHEYGHGLNPGDPMLYYDTQTSVGGDGSELALAMSLLAEGSDAELAAAVDLEGFFGVSVTRSVMGSMDAFSADGNNYYFYDDHGLLRLIPWDFDVDLGGYYFSTALTVDPRQPWVTSPWSTDSITGAPYTDPVLLRALAAGYSPESVIADLLAGPMDWALVDQEAADGAALIRDHVANDFLGDLLVFDQRAADLRLFLHTRIAALSGTEPMDCPDLADGVLAASALVTGGTVGWGTLMVDSSNWGPGHTVAGEHHCTGVFAHAPSVVTLEIPPGYGGLTGAVGIQDWNQRCGDGATFQVSQGGAVLWESGSLGTYDPAESFGPVAVSPGTVTLSTGVNGGYACDTTSWLGLALTPD